jgi:outer membrane protein OmpA-like peptidoglycan-associated protein
MNRTVLRSLDIVLALVFLGSLIGCAGKELAPKDPYMYWYYPKELPEADRAVEAAHQAGKDKECSAEFKAAEDLKNNAYKVYSECRTEEAIAMAKEATKKANALCPSKPLPAPEPKPAPSPPPPPPPPPPAPAPKVIDRMTLEVNFDFDKSNIRKEDKAKLQEAVDFVKKYPGAKVRLEGHTDSIGTEQYNQALSERRAESVKNYLVKGGAAEDSNITTIGYGETKPVADNNTKEGRAKNRRVEILILSE